MIPQPQRYVGGQALRADILNQILDTLRRTQPIAGTGVMVRYSSNGTIISLQKKRTAQQESEPLVHPFKVTLSRTAATSTEENSEEGTEETLTATVYKGRVFKMVESTNEESGTSSIDAQEVTPELEGLTESDSGWTVEKVAVNDVLYLKHDATAGTYTLGWGTKPETGVLFEIATVPAQGSEPDECTLVGEVQQHILSDLYIFPLPGESDGGGSSSDGSSDALPDLFVYVPEYAEITKDEDGNETSNSVKACFEYVAKGCCTDAEGNSIETPSILRLTLPKQNLSSGKTSTDVFEVDLTQMQEVFCCSEGEDEGGTGGGSGDDGATYTPSWRYGDGETADNATEAYVDWTNSETKDVIKGEVNLKGKNGVTYTPTLVTAERGGCSGVYIDWVGTDGSTIEGTVNIKGADGEDGKDGVDGKDGKDASESLNSMEINVVTGVSWDSGSHKLIQTVQPITVYYASVGTSCSSDVLTATPHSAEHCSG